MNHTKHVVNSGSMPCCINIIRNGIRVIIAGASAMVIVQRKRQESGLQIRRNSASMLGISDDDRIRDIHTFYVHTDIISP